MSFNKPSKTYQELIQILNRHLLIPDENQAIEFLKIVHYYRLSAYFPPFYDAKNSFKPISQRLGIL